jgi:hypothetical protein
MPYLPRTPILNSRRIGAAFAVAILADVVQMLLGPLGWVFLDQALDLVVMVLTIALVGFHPLLLPTFLIELLPGVDLLPTWTASVAVVVALRIKQARSAGVPPISESPRVIDV